MRISLRILFLFSLFTIAAFTVDAEEIKLRSLGGVYTVPVRLNDMLTVDFLIDTGAADVGLSDEIAGRLVKTGVMGQGDFKGEEGFTLADGSTVKCRSLVIRSIRIGGREVSDVKGSACPGNAPLLLGQTFLKKLGPWALDYGRESLVLMSDVKKPAAPPAYAPRDVEWQELAGAEGDAAAQFNLARIFFAGDGVTRDPGRALSLLQQSAAQGYAPAQGELAGMYLDGTGVPKNAAKAFELYSRAADRGYPPALVGLSSMYRDGVGCKKDIAKGLSLLRAAAGRGDDVAAVNLGLAYQYGLGVPKDLAAATEWYSKGAAGGGLFSQYHLGMAYMEDAGGACIGGARDSGACQGGSGLNAGRMAEGAALIRGAAESGLANAQSTLGSMYYGGNGVPKDLVLAYAWYQVALARLMSVPEEMKKFVEKEIGDARDSIAFIEKELAPADVAAGKAFAAAWKPGKPIKRI